MIPTTALILIAKQPLSGESKTRLQPPYTAPQAAALAEALLMDSVTLISGLSRVIPAIAVTPENASGFFADLTRPGTLLLPVSGAHIGDVLDQVLTRLLATGFHKALALNGDGPSTPQEYLLEAVAALDDHDVVYGPSEDGGFYLVGLNAPHPGLFTHIDWSTPMVMAQSLAKAEAARLGVHMLPAWYDVDTMEDVRRLREEVSAQPQRLPHCRSFFEHHDR